MVRIALAIALMAVVLAPRAAPAQSATIAVQQAFARATPAGAKNGAVYMTIVNHGASEDRLVAASTPVAGRAELHRTIDEGGVMKMRPVDAIPIPPAGGQAVLKPGGLHLMLLGLTAPLKLGQAFPLTLVFAKAGQLTVTVMVEKPGAMGTMSGMSM
jgi:copper(I)-binding protein